MKIVPVNRVLISPFEANKSYEKPNQKDLQTCMGKDPTLNVCSSFSEVEAKKIEKPIERIDEEISKRADLNGDGLIDDHDLLEFLFNFPKGYDVNGDGKIDDQDLTKLLKLFGRKLY